MKEMINMRKCEWCGDGFEPVKHNQRHCSRQHQVAAYRVARAEVEKAARERQRARLRGLR